MPRSRSDSTNQTPSPASQTSLQSPGRQMATQTKTSQTLRQGMAQECLFLPGFHEMSTVRPQRGGLGGEGKYRGAFSSFCRPWIPPPPFP